MGGPTPLSRPFRGKETDTPRGFSCSGSHLPNRHGEGRAGWSTESDAAAEKEVMGRKMGDPRRAARKRAKEEASGVLPWTQSREKRPARIALPYSSSVIRSTGPVALHPRLTTGSPLLQGSIDLRRDNNSRSTRRQAGVPRDLAAAEVACGPNVSRHTCRVTPDHEKRDRPAREVRYWCSSSVRELPFSTAPSGGRLGFPPDCCIYNEPCRLDILRKSRPSLL